MRTYDTIIIGGGAIGLATAYYMKKSGLDVLVIERDSAGNGCSYGNAGYIVPSHFVPLASPGMIGKGLRWMFSPQSPFSITPKPDADMIRWLMKFSKYCSRNHVERTGHLIYDLNLHSKNLYTELSEHLRFTLATKGLLMLYKTRHGAQEEKELARKAVDMGIDARILEPSDLQVIEPAIGPEVTGAVHYNSDAHLNPSEMMLALKSFLEGSLIHCTVKGFSVSNNSINAVETSCGSFSARNVVVAAGYASKQILKKLGYNLLLESGKGYSFKVPMHTAVSIPAILTEARVAVTPLGGQIQFAGTMQIGKSLGRHTQGKILGIVNSVGSYFPDYAMNNTIPREIWAGLRPLSPDGLPYIGKTAKYKNLLIATGHAMMGISLAPVTGQIITDIVNGKSTGWDMESLSPDRF
jgi:D-amino-acid dehydrogenase